MKPRTKLQRRVFALSESLPRLTEKQKSWAYRECLEHRGLATKHRVLCMDCGGKFSTNLVKRKRAVCPHCSTKIQVRNSQKRTDKQITYFALTTIVEEFQVVRNYELIAYYRETEKPRYFLHEILQYWIQPDDKVTMVGLTHHLSGYADSWGGEWGIKRETGYYKKYDVYPRKYSPDSKFKKEYRKYGINSRLDGFNVIDAIKILPHNHYAETLLKARQYELLYSIKKYPRNYSMYWPSIKICLRNKYKVKDADMWKDYIDLLRHFNRDVRNAKYVCPKNLKKEHDRLVKKKRDIERKQEIKRKREKIKQAQKDYAKAKKAFMGLQFAKGKIQVRFLNTVKEVMEEGDLLKHCVFVNNYYEKSTLLFSALVNGERTATVEVDPKQLRVVQIRGIHNNPTKYDDKIKKLIQQNMEKISKKLNRKSKLQIAS